MGVTAYHPLRVSGRRVEEDIAIVSRISALRGGEVTAGASEEPVGAIYSPG